MGTQRRITLDFTIDGSPVTSETSCLWAGPYVLVIATAIRDLELATELHSTFVGHTPEPTHVTHLMIGLGPRGRSRTFTDEHPRAYLDPEIKVRECVYEHVAILLRALTTHGYETMFDVPDDAFEELERVEI